MLNGNWFHKRRRKKKACVFWKSSSLPDDSRALNSLLLSHPHSHTSQRPLPPQSLLDLILDECASSSTEWMVDQRSVLLLCNINISHRALKKKTQTNKKITTALKWAFGDAEYEIMQMKHWYRYWSRSSTLWVFCGSCFDLILMISQSTLCRLLVMLMVCFKVGLMFVSQQCTL